MKSLYIVTPCSVRKTQKIEAPAQVVSRCWEARCPRVNIGHSAKVRPLPIRVANPRCLKL